MSASSSSRVLQRPGQGQERRLQRGQGAPAAASRGPPAPWAGPGARRIPCPTSPLRDGASARARICSSTAARKTSIGPIGWAGNLRPRQSGGGAMRPDQPSPGSCGGGADRLHQGVLAPRRWSATMSASRASSPRPRPAPSGPRTQRRSSAASCARQRRPRRRRRRRRTGGGPRRTRCASRRGLDVGLGPARRAGAVEGRLGHHQGVVGDHQVGAARGADRASPRNRRGSGRSRRGRTRRAGRPGWRREAWAGRPPTAKQRRQPGREVAAGHVAVARRLDPSAPTRPEADQVGWRPAAPRWAWSWKFSRQR